MCGSTFNKPPLSLQKQIDLLEARGMVLGDKVRATHYLRFIGYYRLSGYWVPFQLRDNSEAHDRFRPGTSFEQVLELYVFDRRLRIIVMDAVERIEVAARSTISNHMSEKFGAHWYLDSNNFATSYDHKDFLKRARKDIVKANAEFINHYKSKYNSPQDPPSWMLFEVLPFGSVSIIFKNLNNDDRNDISYHFGMPRDRLGSWLHAASHLRNLCAHHSRVWNRNFGVKPSVEKKNINYIPEPKKFYNHAVAMQTILKTISGDTHWVDRLRSLLNDYPQIPLKPMGFPPRWWQDPMWK